MRRHISALLQAPRAEPLDLGGVKSMTAGTAIWVVALIVLLPFRSELADDGHGWWLWTCVTGVVLGLIGIVYCVRRRQRLRGARAGTSAPPRL